MVEQAVFDSAAAAGVGIVALIALIAMIFMSNRNMASMISLAASIAGATDAIKEALEKQETAGENSRARMAEVVQRLDAGLGNVTTVLKPFTGFTEMVTAQHDDLAEGTRMLQSDMQEVKQQLVEVRAALERLEQTGARCEDMTRALELLGEVQQRLARLEAQASGTIEQKTEGDTKGDESE